MFDNYVQSIFLTLITAQNSNTKITMKSQRINRESRWHEQFPNFQPLDILELAIHRENRVGPVNTFCAGTLEPERDKIRRKGTKREKRKKKRMKPERKRKKEKRNGNTFHPPCRRSPLLFQYPWMAALSNIECQYLRAPRSTFILCPKYFFL